MDKQERIENLNDIREALIEAYGNDKKFALDLAEIVLSIDARIALIKKGEV